MVFACYYHNLYDFFKGKLQKDYKICKYLLSNLKIFRGIKVSKMCLITASVRLLR